MTLISNANFLVKEIPVLHPKSREYLIFWRKEKQSCVEGMWSGGKWMPGPLYFYINYWHILLNKSKYSKVKALGKPYLRDIEWDKAYVYTEARGFSGFEEDEERTCNMMLRDLMDECDPDSDNFEYPELKDHPEYEHLSPHCFKKDGSPKTYVHARSYLRENHGKSLGRPLYENQSKNVVDIECRGSGKSYIASGMMIGHNFLMDGATNYQEYLDAWKEGKPLSSETLVGAINTSYSADLLSKFSLGLESLEGGVKIGKQYFPSPLFKQTKGTLAPGKNPLYAAYDKKEGGTWQEVGSRSKIHHRSFKDKPTAGNGTRPGLVILEEVGFMGNLKDTLGPLRMCTADGAVQFGTTYMFGTGGDMDGGATQAVMEVFFEPEAWDCLAFPDYYESDGSRSIGYFVPYTLGLNQYKDSEGNTDIEAADAFVEKVRNKLSKATSKKPLNDELQNNPVVPSEAFLVTSGNIFPIQSLQDQLNFIQTSTTDFVKGELGTIKLDQGMMQGVSWVPDIKGELEPASYPVPKGADMEGCIQIWEHPPSGQIPRGMYIAGTDPYDQDKAGESSSLGSTFVYKIGDFREGGLRDIVVAEYTGRPERAYEHHENVRRLLMYYNALDLYENEKNSIKFYFDAKNSLHLLSNTPSILKANASGTVQRTYGQHMTVPVKSELETFTRDWLTEEVGDPDESGEVKTNVNQIYSAGLLKELIMYNNTGNFDRVIAFMLLICNRMQHHNVVVEKKKDIELDTYWTRKHFV